MFDPNAGKPIQVSKLLKRSIHRKAVIYLVRSFAALQIKRVPLLVHSMSFISYLPKAIMVKITICLVMPFATPYIKLVLLLLHTTEELVLGCTN